VSITYTEKGAGLHDRIQQLGHWLAQRNGVWVSSDDEAVQAIIDDYTEADQAAWARAQIRPVTRRQMLTALHRVGLLATIKAAVEGSGDIELQIAFDESQEFQRDNPFLASMAVALNKTDAEIDAVFMLAATL
jgi:nitrogen regulatory protein PII